jgi:hypothetical protein
MADQALQPRSDDGATVTLAPSPADAVHSSVRDDLLLAAADPALTEDLTLALLKRADLPADVLDQLAKNLPVLKSRKVKIVLACHPHTPRRISIPLIRQFYTFDLMKVALSPMVPADVKLTADEALIARLKMIGVGERLTLARRGSGRIAGALLLDADQRVMHAALDNSRLTEAPVVQAVLNTSARPALIHEVSRHAKWSYRRDVQIALLRTAHLSLARALVFAASFSPGQLREILANSRLPHKITEHLLRESHNDPSD